VRGPIVQIFGKKKCPDSRKAERWFKERGIKIQSIELAEKGLSPGELVA
jgi:arsenate reductase (glutaredoxin)